MWYNILDVISHKVILLVVILDMEKSSDKAISAIQTVKKAEWYHGSIPKTKMVFGVHWQ